MEQDCIQNEIKKVKNSTRSKSLRAINKAGIRKQPCFLCEIESAIELHHTDYNSCFSIMPVCVQCHSKIHKYLKAVKLPVPAPIYSDSFGGRKVFRIGYPEKSIVEINAKELKNQYNALLEHTKNEITYLHLIINELLLCTGNTAFIIESTNKYLEVISLQDFDSNCVYEDGSKREGSGYNINLILRGYNNIYFTPNNLSTILLDEAWKLWLKEENNTTLMHTIINELYACTGHKPVMFLSDTGKLFVCSQWQTLKDSTGQAVLLSIKTSYKALLEGN